MILDALCLPIKMASKAVAKSIVYVSALYFGRVLSEDCSLIHVHLHVKSILEQLKAYWHYLPGQSNILEVNLPFAPLL